MRNQSDSVALRNEHLVSKIKDIKAENKQEQQNGWKL